MASNREMGGVFVAFAGFVFVVGAFKGTWRDAWASLIGKDGATPGAATASASGGSGLPGTSVVPLALTPARAGEGAAGSRLGLKDVFSDQLGYSVDEGLYWNQTIGKHGKHVHVSTFDPVTMLAVLREAVKRGLTIRENPLYDKVDPVHVAGSDHYKVFADDPRTSFDESELGTAADISGVGHVEFARWLTGTYV